MKAVLSLLGETFRQWSAHKVPKMGAALSFYTVFSLAPLLVLLLSLISLVVERNAARADIVAQFRAVAGDQEADVVQMILAKAAAANSGSLGPAVGFLVLLVGASGVFGELQDSMNQIWGVKTQSHPLFAMVKERAFSFAMVFVLGFLMLVSFMFSAALGAAGSYLHARFPELDGPWEWVNSGISFLLIAAVFAMIYRGVPDAPVWWRDVWPGALIAALLFVLGKVVLGFYFGRSAIAFSYGAAGSLVIILVWVYYSAQILFFGAEFTYVYAQRHGSRRSLQEAEYGGKDVDQAP